ncbi:FAD-dependent oxidoreductase isoform B [Chlorella sorokiniana]|uniref:FAD-dependent oxidoreductase isoform B n=1 Tax=Chlorella sorokiniana TaxID=3076 RepID=A0A2P6TV95_CHLSO|nr:FAD-dependent oxidoreductase isoform B [Chlorella sorokiniana]|eukprot:PRW57992.1 FAD-dependent oxidoreductase isoform B [Chlorella sorokiniana]
MALAPIRGSLVQCLRDNNIDVVTGTDYPTYLEASQTFSKLFRSWPSAIAYPNNTEEVAAAVKCAAKYNTAVRPRCGGHGNEGESVTTGALTLDLSRMSTVKMAKDGNSVTVQAGARVGTVIAQLWKQSNGTRGFPGGQRPTVGISGYTLGGGFGGTTRWAGLAGDNLIALTAIDGKGRILRADHTKNSDLLWVSRGGGGGRIALITEFVFRTMDVSTKVTQLSALIPRDRAVEVTNWWQTWQSSLSNKFTTRVDYTNNTDDGQVSVELTGWCMGGQEECERELNATIAEDKPVLDLLIKLSESDLTQAIQDVYLNAVVNGIGWEVPEGYTALEAVNDPQAWLGERSYYKYKTVILQEPLPPEGIQAVLDYASSGERGTRVFEFQALGGAAAEVPKLATAAANLRTAGAILILRANSKNESEALIALHNATQTIDKLIKLVPRYQAYVSFVDTDIVAFADWQSAYYGDALEGVVCANLKYDPSDIFTMPLDLASDNPGLSEADSDKCNRLLRKLGAEAAAWSRHLMKNAPARG